MSVGNAVFKQVIMPLEKYLKRKDIVELCINEPEEIWLELKTGEWQKKKDKSLTISNMRTLAETLATMSGQKFSHEIPIYSGRIPQFENRIQVNMGAMVESGISISIRVGSVGLFALDSYMPKEEADTLAEMVRIGKTIMINSGTGCGKTTFFNAMISHIPLEQRIITIEDTRELIIPHNNKVHLLKSKTSSDIAKLDYAAYINTVTRLRPDRILLGEIDIENTMVFLNLSNSGHSGGISTIHSESPQEAINRLCLNASLSGSQGSKDDHKEYAYSAIDAFVTLTKRIVDGKREFKAKVTLTKDLM